MVKLALTPEMNQDPLTEAQQIEALQAELDAYYAAIKRFPEAEPGEAFVTIAAMSGRASEIRSHLVRQESRRAQAFRTREIDPFIEELERQFRIYSRIQSVRQQEWEMAKGFS